MEEPRPEKVAVVDEVRERLSASQAALVTEYRGISVSDLQALRRSLRDAGGEYKVYKNTLVRFAARDLGLELDELLTGPTAIAFVPQAEGADPVNVAKALKAFGKDNPNLVIKGGVLGERILSADDAKALADVAPREELLARLAGGFAAPMQQLAGLLQALPRNFAYALQALIAEGGGTPATAGTESPTPDAEESAPAEAEADAAQAADDTDEAPADAEAAPTEES